MNNDAIAAKLDALDRKIDAEFSKVNTRLDQTVTKSDVVTITMSLFGYTSAIIVAVVLILNILGKLN